MKRFSIVENGYDINEVNRFIDVVIERLEKLNTENASYVAKIDKLNSIIQEKSELSSNNINLEKTILAIQETSDRIKNVALDEANIIVEEAKNNANSIIHEALVKAQQIEQDRLLLEKNIKIYKEKTRSMIEAQLRIADDLDKIELGDI